MPPEAARDGALPEQYHQHDLLPPPPGHWHPLGWRGPHRHVSRDPGVLATSDRWLEDRRRTEGAEGLWRVEDNLYDLTPFMDRHPGGAEWLQLTKGTDVTEVFFSHHIASTAEEVLPKFLVRPAVEARHSPVTFHRDGFYMQLRERARKVLADTPAPVLRAAERRSKWIVDCLAAGTLLTSALAARLGSLPLGALAGLLLALTTGAAHNFFHQKPNWRRFYFDLSFMSSREWMISHALSHHIFPNTMMDLEVTFFEPLVCFLPYLHKPWAVRYLAWFYCLILYASLGHAQFAKRITALRWSDAVGLAVPAAMLLAGAGLWQTWLMWTWVLIVSSLYFGFQGLSAGHHHPDNYHEGDAVSLDKDFGLMQLAATADCTGIRGRESLLMCITHFGDHLLHHLFPSLDQAVLPLLEPALAEHMFQYHLPRTKMPALEAVKGKYLQMARNKPNAVPFGIY